MRANTADFAQTLTHFSPQLNWMREQKERERDQQPVITKLAEFLLTIPYQIEKQSLGENGTLPIVFHLGN